MIRHADSLLERLPLVSYMLRVDEPSPVVYVSPQIEQIFGIPPAAFEDDTTFWTNQILEQDRPVFLDALETLRRGGSGAKMAVEYRVGGLDGLPVWVRDIAAAEDDYISGCLVDITREKELEEQLALERATLDAFFTHSAIGLGITDEAGRYVRINGALARQNGGSPGDFIGRTLAETAPHIADVVDPLSRGREAGEHRIDIDHPGGRIQALLSYFPFLVGEERYLGRVVVDLSAQRQAEATAQRYRHLIEQLPLVSYVNEVEPARRAIFVSPHIEDLTGYAPDHFIADETLADRLIHPDDLRDIEERERTATDRGDPFEHEYRIVRADGEFRWVIDRMETVRDGSGSALYEQGFLVDVTERHDTLALLRAVWDGALDAMVIADDDGRYVDANPAACALFGRPHDEIVGLHIRDVVEESTAMWDEFRARGSIGAEAVVVRPDGERRDVEGAARADVMPGRHLAMFRDVTERKQMESEIWRAQKLESVARLAGGVAHDFNNLLTAIRGYAQLLQARAAAGSVEQHHAVEIDRAADRAAALTAQLLALGRRQTMQPRSLDLNRHLESSADSLVDLAGVGTAVVFDLAPELHAVRGDGPLLAQAIANIVGNAAEAMPAGGTLRISTRNADVSGRDDLVDGRYAVLSVEDTGPGLDESTLEHIFEPFFTTKDEGAAARGLGLASAYGTVKQSGGTITVESTPGAGTTFSIYLPEAARTSGAPVPQGSGETVLLVERDPAVRDVVFELLTDASYRVITSRTTAEAVRLAERFDGPVDLLLTDLDELREQALVSLLRDGRPALRVASLPRPYTPDRLKRAVRDALDSPKQVTSGHTSA